MSTIFTAFQTGGRKKTPGRRRATDASLRSSQESVEINIDDLHPEETNNNNAGADEISQIYNRGRIAAENHKKKINTKQKSSGIFVPDSRVRTNPRNLGGNNTDEQQQQPFASIHASYYDYDDDETDFEALNNFPNEEHRPSTNNRKRGRNILQNLPPYAKYVIVLALFAIARMGGGGGGGSINTIPVTFIDTTLDIISFIPGSSLLGVHRSHHAHSRHLGGDKMDGASVDDEDVGPRPEFVYEHPYVSSSYYTSTKSIETLMSTEEHQVMRNLRREAEEAAGLESHEIKTRLAIVRPFCEFDAEALPTTFTCWNALPPCKAASDDIGDDLDEEFGVDVHGQLVSYKNSTAGHNLYDAAKERHLFDLVGSDAMKNAKADVFLFYSQTFSENDVAIKAVDAIIDQFFEPGGWSQCFGNIYAIEANIPQELDLYIPSAQEELYNWVNGPNRQFEAAFRIIQSGEWGEYDGFYLMEGDSVPIKAHWLDVVLSEIEVNRPFAILGAQYDGDKWDNFYEKIPISLLHHTNGNAIYNTSHPLLERLVGQLEVEAPCPYNSIPYDYRMSQMWVEGTLGIVPELAPKIMLNEEGENITLSDNIQMFKKWAEIWERDDPFKYTPVIHNYAATNLIPRHLGPEYIIHGAKLYSPWNPTKTDVTLVVSEWFFDRSLHLISNLDEKDHPFSEVVVMVPPVAGSHDDYDELTDVPVRTQHRGAPDFMDLCEADVETDWFMITNSYHHVARHVDLMFTPGTFKPVIPFTPATYAFCFKYPYCKETVNLAQRFYPGHDKVVLDMDMLYNTKDRNAFCEEWKRENGEEGEDLYKHQQRRLMFRKKIIGPPGPTGTAYVAWLVREKKDGQYKMTDRSLYGARPPFNKIFAKEEKLDGMSEDELAKRVGMMLFDNTTSCNCGEYETEEECAESDIGCIWRPLFESCHPPELIDGSEPICATTQAPTMSPTLPLPEADTESPTSSGTAAEEETTEADPWYTSMFKSREHDGATSETNDTDSSLWGDDDEIVEPSSTRKLGMGIQDPLYETDDDATPEEPEEPATTSRKLETTDADSLYETDLNADQRIQDLDWELKQEDEEISIMREEEAIVKEKISTLLARLVDQADENERDLQQEDDELSSLKEKEKQFKSNISVLTGRYDDDDNEDEIPGIPLKTCDSWEPSIVFRYPTKSNAWSGASIDTESRSHSAMAVSRPRKLHGSFLRQQQDIVSSSTFDYSSPLKDSWMTTSVPINAPKYDMYQQGYRAKLTELDTPDVDRKTFVNYGDSDAYQPLRIFFATEHLNSYKHRHAKRKHTEHVTMDTISRIESLTGDVLPAVSEIWAAALSVLPSVGNIFPYQDQEMCGEATIAEQYFEQGFPNTDIVVYVTIDGPSCYTDEATENLVSYATVCSFDQHMRPISANIDICLGHIDVSLGEVNEEENLRLTSTLTIEVGKALGLSPSLFHHFRNSESGQPYGSTEKTVTCVDGTEQTLMVPNVLQSSDDILEPYFQVNTPTVRQVIRNHFDCQSLFGARLNQGEATSCFGDSFDPRYHFDDDLTAIGGSADMAYSLSPLTLALLEDSGWYKASFHVSTVPIFGRGAGCGFVEGACMGDEFNTILPEYSQGFFCNDLPEQVLRFDYQPPPSGCDYTHNHKADCSKAGERESGFCPMRTDNIVSCAVETNAPTLAGEVYSSSSRCFVTDTPTSVCLQSYCNSVDSKIDIVVDGRVHQCDYEGQELDIGSNGYSVKCPRLGVVCPHLVCPSNCSGKGVCDYCLDVPQCVCDDPFDDTLGCYGDPTIVTVESSLKEAVDSLTESIEENTEEVTEGNVADRISSLLSKINEGEDRMQEMQQSEEQITKLQDVEERYKTQITALLPKLINKGEENERALEDEDAEIARLNEDTKRHKARIAELLKLMISKAEENERELQQEDERILQLDDSKHKTKVASLLTHLIAKTEENDAQLKQDDVELSSLQQEETHHKFTIELLQSMEQHKQELHQVDSEILAMEDEMRQEEITDIRKNLEEMKIHQQEVRQEISSIPEDETEMSASEAEMSQEE